MHKQPSQVAPKNKTIYKEIMINPYRVEMWLIITNSPSYECAKLNQKHKNLNLIWPEDAAAITEDTLYRGMFLPVVFDSVHGIDIATICHEVIHIKNLVFKDRGVMHDYGNDEYESYLCGWLAEQIELAWKEYKKL